MPQEGLSVMSEMLSAGERKAPQGKPEHISVRHNLTALGDKDEGFYIQIRSPGVIQFLNNK